jgi:hypothetical protein
MRFSREEGSRAMAACVTNDEIVTWLRDGREVHTPLSHSRILSRAPARKRQRLELLGGGMGLHWPALDEDLLVEGLIRDASAIRMIGRVR